MQDRPDGAELLRAARDFCERDLVPALTGRVRFHARVLQNVLGILEREWNSEEDVVGREWERLRALLGKHDSRPGTFRETKDQVRAWNADLAGSIRRGEMDDRLDYLIASLTETVAEKLAIANPGYASTSAGSSEA